LWRDRSRAARAQHALALIQANEIGDLFEQARAHAGLASVAQELHDTKSAQHHHEQALARYGELRLPEADQLRAQLSA
jgi:hypothetical protein